MTKKKQQKNKTHMRKFQSIEQLNIYLKEQDYDEVDYVGKEDEQEFLFLLNEKLGQYYNVNGRVVNLCLMKMENNGDVDKFC